MVEWDKTPYVENVGNANATATTAADREKVLEIVEAFHEPRGSARVRLVDRIATALAQARVEP